MGLFVTFEGGEGAGKSTQVRLLAQALADRSPVVVREPGGTPLGEHIRELLLHRDGMSPQAETYLFMAARAELVDTVITPALAGGRPVIADRYHDSTLAYQRGGRGVHVDWPSGFPKPDLTVLLALPPEAGLDRHSGRGADRMERESLAFHQRVAEAYDRLVSAEPGRFLRLDAAMAPDELHRLVMDRVRAIA